MASLTSSLLRMLPLRRRYALVGLMLCFGICLLIYSTIPSQPNKITRMIVKANSALDAEKQTWSLASERARGAVKDWIIRHNDHQQQQQRQNLPRPLPKSPVEQPPPVVKKAPPSLEAVAHRSRLGSGVDVYSGSLAQVVHVPFDFNVSSERVDRLRANTMLFRQLAKEVADTRAYLASVQPDFDVNAGSCRCGRSISSECSCCARLTMKRFYLERKGCVNFTYVLKDQLLRVRLSYDGKLLASRSLKSSHPPMLCAGREMDLCAAFRNVSYRVQLDSPDHKTSLSGCLDLLLRLNVKPIAIYPLGCFRTGRDPKLVHIDKMNNWVP